MLLIFMENKIKHAGIIDSVEGEHVKVKIVQASACASCKAAKICNASESKEKIIDIYADNADKYIKGQNVMVTASYNAGITAVTIGMLIPMGLLIVVLAILTAINVSEITAALTALAVLIPYYAILFFFRNQINKKFSFNIEKEENIY